MRRLELIIFNSTIGTNVEIVNNTDRALIRDECHSYQMKSWPPNWFPARFEPHSVYRGRIERYCDICRNLGDTAAEAYYYVEGSGDSTIKFDFTFWDMKISWSGCVRADTDQVRLNENSGRGVSILPA